MIGIYPVFADYQVLDENIYLDEVVEFNPEQAGSARTGAFEVGMIGSDRMPLLNDFALGAPTGTGSGTSSCENDGLIVGINGSAVFRFQEGYYIFDGPGDDFRSWGDRFCWGNALDGHCCELAHIQVSEDGETWYYNGEEAYDVNPNPTGNNGDYMYHSNDNLHGNTPNWANYQKDMQAYEEVNGYWKKISGVVVPKDFNAWTPYMGGDTYDLSNYRSVDDDSPWPADGKMRYIKMIDDDEILDGQAYALGWVTGAIMQASMGINVMKESSECDLDYDGDVDRYDAKILRSAVGSKEGDSRYLEQADFDDDGDVDFADYRLWYAAYKQFIAQ